MPYANNKSADQPGHTRSLISTFVVRCLDSIIHILAKSKISRLVSVAEEAGLSLPWSQTPKTGFLVTRLRSSSNRGMLVSSDITKIVRKHYKPPSGKMALFKEGQ